METKTQNLIHSYNYTSYQTLLDSLVENKSCSGELSKEHIDATKVNAYRIKRINQQLKIIPELHSLLSTIKGSWEWLVLMETWCGDGGQNLPLIAKIASLSEKIKFTIILRDENPEIMDAHLTNGSRSIPKLICINRETNQTLGTWGPRPETIQTKVKELKTLFPSITHTEFAAHLHRWYSIDNGLSLQQEFLHLIKQWNSIT